MSEEAWELPFLQSLIDTGDAWRLEGSVGRAAMAALEDGTCVLPTVAHRDYWGNRIPARGDVTVGTLGSLEYANRLREERRWPRLVEREDGTVEEERA